MKSECVVWYGELFLIPKIQLIVTAFSQYSSYNYTLHLCVHGESLGHSHTPAVDQLQGMTRDSVRERERERERERDVYFVSDVRRIILFVCAFTTKWTQPSYM